MIHFFVWPDRPRPKLTYKLKIGPISDKTFCHKNELEEWKIHSAIQWVKAFYFNKKSWKIQIMISAESTNDVEGFFLHIM